MRVRVLCKSAFFNVMLNLSTNETRQAMWLHLTFSLARCLFFSLSRVDFFAIFPRSIGHARAPHTSLVLKDQENRTAPYHYALSQLVHFGLCELLKATWPSFVDIQCLKITAWWRLATTIFSTIHFGNVLIGRRRKKNFTRNAWMAKSTNFQSATFPKPCTAHVALNVFCLQSIANRKKTLLYFNIQRKKIWVTRAFCVHCTFDIQEKICTLAHTPTTLSN